jgi:MerR family transcriptional regulator, light-induced transcriptional regulator
MAFVGEPVPVLGLTVGAVARRLGLAPATLRTWDRRYGLGPTGHAAGAHRRYTPADVARLEQVRRLTLTGVAPAEAARAVLQGVTAPAARALPGGDGRAAEVDGERAGRPGGPGGRVIALPTGDPHARGLARAAMALDDRAARALVVAALEARGVLDTWDRLLVPVLRGVGDRWQGSGEGVEVEHLLSESIRFALLAHTATTPEPEPVRPALLACVADEEHCLPLYALAAALAERCVPARVLGGSLPKESLTAAARRTGPASVFLWSQQDATGRPDYADAVPLQRPPVAVVVGGPGWPDGPLPPRLTRAHDLGEAVHLLTLAAGLG